MFLVHVYIVYLPVILVSSIVEKKTNTEIICPFRWPESCTRSRPSIPIPSIVCVSSSPARVISSKRNKEIKSRKKGIMLESAAFGEKPQKVTACQVLARPRIRKMQVERQSLCRVKERVWS